GFDQSRADKERGWYMVGLQQRTRDREMVLDAIVERECNFAAGRGACLQPVHQCAKGYRLEMVAQESQLPLKLLHRQLRITDDVVHQNAGFPDGTCPSDGRPRPVGHPAKRGRKGAVQEVLGHAQLIPPWRRTATDRNRQSTRIEKPHWEAPRIVSARMRVAQRSPCACLHAPMALASGLS